MSKNVKWKTIPNFPNYKISRDGVVMNAKTNYVLKKPLTNGYHMVNINNMHGEKRFYVHRLVALTFIPNPKNLPLVDHIDNVKTNNWVTNLRWVTVSENTRSYYDNYAPKNPIIQSDTNGNFIKEWRSQREILNANPTYRKTNLGHCIIGKGKTAYGYVWRRKFAIDKKVIQQKIAKGEIFKTIKKFDENDLSKYKVSNKGNVINDKGKFMCKKNIDGYKGINLAVKPNVTKTYRIHRLVAETFIKNNNPDKKRHVNHIDRNRANNCVENLEWITQGDNNKHANGIPVKMIDPITFEVVKKFKCMKDANRFLELPVKSISISNACKDENLRVCAFKWAHDD
ncbi:HNH endonuclease [Cotonvirus japonicus]|uniref:HNH endonuclease n=1 Tax=Cotonvirus japonicus TaxID=2811091 RepID=A0ABM7NSM4_9VIRU|nr:HNH endonuclease [Cotonvirus japonicus]BCS83116.1 HNH endonuclease [Cotonvirus japonicus]